MQSTLVWRVRTKRKSWRDGIASPASIQYSCGVREANTAISMFHWETQAVLKKVKNCLQFLHRSRVSRAAPRHKVFTYSIQPCSGGVAAEVLLLRPPPSIGVVSSTFDRLADSLGRKYVRQVNGNLEAKEQSLYFRLTVRTP